MILLELKKKWDQLSINSSSKGFKSLRISSQCFSDLFIGVDQEGNRSLILSLPSGFDFHFDGIIKENMKIEFFKEKNVIVLQLCDKSFYDLFDDLILSLYSRIRDIEEPNEYCKELIYTFSRWSEFFESKSNDLLDENVIKGLFGELLVLKSLVVQSNVHTINQTLLSWQGPYDKAHDFELSNKNLEVKTKDLSQIDIKISSEFQLQNELGKTLELVVVIVERNSIVGICISDLVLEIKKNIVELLGDSFIFLKAIGQKRITQKNMYQYDKILFKPIQIIAYDCSLNDFPKLIRNNIPKEINKVIYNLRISELKKFIISKTNF